MTHRLSVDCSTQLSYLVGVGPRLCFVHTVQSFRSLSAQARHTEPVPLNTRKLFQRCGTRDFRHRFVFLLPPGRTHEMRRYRHGEALHTLWPCLQAQKTGAQKNPGGRNQPGFFGLAGRPRFVFQPQFARRLCHRNVPGRGRPGTGITLQCIIKKQTETGHIGAAAMQFVLFKLFAAYGHIRLIKRFVDEWRIIDLH